MSQHAKTEVCRLRSFKSYRARWGQTQTQTHRQTDRQTHERRNQTLPMVHLRVVAKTWSNAPHNIGNFVTLIRSDSQQQECLCSCWMKCLISISSIILQKLYANNRTLTAAWQSDLPGSWGLHTVFSTPASCSPTVTELQATLPGTAEHTKWRQIAQLWLTDCATAYVRKVHCAVVYIHHHWLVLPTHNDNTHFTAHRGLEAESA